MRVAIIEDDTAQEKELREYLTKYFSDMSLPIEIVSFGTADEFLSAFRERLYNMIFMDIEMQGTNGMEASKILRKKDEDVLLFFVTNLAQYALESYDVSAFDYIVKPINYYNLALKMKRALRLLKNGDDPSIIINAADGQHIVKIDDIRYVEVFGHSVTYHTVKGDIFVGYDSMRSVCAKLEPYDFALCDRSFLVNLKCVTGENKGDLYLGDDVLKIAKSRRTEFMRELMKYYSGDDR